MNDKMRERFEAAVEAMNLGYRRENMTRNRAGEYHKVTFQLMWLAWQAACEECARRCEERSTDGDAGVCVAGTSTPGVRIAGTPSTPLPNAGDALAELLASRNDERDTDALRARCDALESALRQICFLDHNEREWESVDEVKAFARRALEGEP